MPAGVRVLTAPSSSRSRLTVAWVTATPASASSRPSSVWLATGRLSSSSTMRAWRAAFVRGASVVMSASAVRTPGDLADAGQQLADGEGLDEDVVVAEQRPHAGD